MSNTIHLSVWIVGHRNGALIHTRVLAIFHYANNGSPKLVAELMSDRIHAGHQFLDERLVDYGNARRSFGVAIINVSSLDYWYAHHLKKVRSHVVGTKWSFGERTHDTVDDGLIVVAPTSARAIFCKRDGFDAGQAAKTVEQRTIKLQILRSTRCLLRCDAEDEKTVGPHP